MHYYLLIWHDHHTEQLKDQSHNVQYKRSDEIESCIFVKHKNSVRLHSFHIHNTISDMDMKTMCPYTSLYNKPPHWKYG